MSARRGAGITYETANNAMLATKQPGISFERSGMADPPTFLAERSIRAPGQSSWSRDTSITRKIGSRFGYNGTRHRPAGVRTIRENR
jgi:hypothetical protein